MEQKLKFFVLLTEKWKYLLFPAQDTQLFRMSLGFIDFLAQFLLHIMFAHFIGWSFILQILTGDDDKNNYKYLSRNILH